tara:strand:- start:9441 stop:11390 length:1950 start_codon:yes stop_codon:yes gene_type:complete
MSDRSLLIVRGSSTFDPTFSCIAHTTDTGNYAAIEFRDGLVSGRTLYRGSERNVLEKLAQSNEFTSVYADTRVQANLLPFTYPRDAIEADLNLFRRTKSDEEIVSITRMAGILDASRNNARDEMHFRGTVENLNYKHAMQETHEKHATIRRYGLQDEYGRTVELSSIEPHTDDWKARVQRMNDGCNAVAQQLKENVTYQELDSTFRAHMDPENDILYGAVVHHSGYQPWEHDLAVDVLKRYDVLTICPVVGDTSGNWVPHMHSIHSITDNDTAFRGMHHETYETLFRGESNDANANMLFDKLKTFAFRFAWIPYTEKQSFMTLKELKLDMDEISAIRQFDKICENLEIDDKMTDTTWNGIELDSFFFSAIRKMLQHHINNRNYIPKLDTYTPIKIHELACFISFMIPFLKIKGTDVHTVVNTEDGIAIFKFHGFSYWAPQFSYAYEMKFEYLYVTGVLGASVETYLSNTGCKDFLNYIQDEIGLPAITTFVTITRDGAKSVTVSSGPTSVSSPQFKFITDLNEYDPKCKYKQYLYWGSLDTFEKTIMAKFKELNKILVRITNNIPENKLTKWEWPHWNLVHDDAGVKEIFRLLCTTATSECVKSLNDYINESCIIAASVHGKSFTKISELKSTRICPDELNLWNANFLK